MATQTAQLTAQSRQGLGTRASRRLRDAGLLPCVIYGHKQSVLPVTLPRKELVAHLSHGTHLFELAIDGANEQVLVKDVQYDHLGHKVIHVDFTRVRLDEKVTVNVEIELRGTPKGQEDGGHLQQLLNELEVECLVTDIPEVIRHSVADMALDDVLHVRDLVLPPGVVSLQPADAIVAMVREIQEEEEPAQGEATEPELIGRKPEGEDADAANNKAE